MLAAMPPASFLAMLLLMIELLSTTELASAANTVGGQLTCGPVAAAFDLEAIDPREAARAL